MVFSVTPPGEWDGVCLCMCDSGDDGRGDVATAGFCSVPYGVIAAGTKQRLKRSVSHAGGISLTEWAALCSQNQKNICNSLCKLWWFAHFAGKKMQIHTDLRHLKRYLSLPSIICYNWFLKTIFTSTPISRKNWDLIWQHFDSQVIFVKNAAI